MIQLAGIVIWWGSVIAAWVIADRKGRRGWAYALVAALLPLLGVFVAAVVTDRR